MAFTYSTAIQDKIAYRLYGVAYASLQADWQNLIDAGVTPATTGGIVAEAETEINQLAQAFEHAGATAAPSVWESWWVALTCLKASISAKPELVGHFASEEKRARELLLDSYTRTTSNASALAGQTIDVANIRSHVLNYIMRRSRKIPQVEEIDSAIQTTLNEIWNMAEWNFRKRQVTLTVQRFAVSGGDWTQSSKTLTDTGAFTSYTKRGGDIFRPTAGTSVLKADQVVSSRTDANNIVLEASLSATAADLSNTDIDGTLWSVLVTGMRSDESFKAAQSRLFYRDGNRTHMKWVTEDEMAELLAHDQDASGEPRRFRISEDGGTFSWHFWPAPDTDYTFHGSVLVAGPGTPSNATDTAVFAKFPTEFQSVIRDAVLLEVAGTLGVDTGELRDRVGHRLSSLLPQYQDTGRPDDDVSVRDVYNDFADVGVLRGGIDLVGGGGL